jgi:hypothetical protein
MATHATEPPTRRTLSWQVRAGIALAVGAVIIFALLRLVSADNSLTRMLDSTQHIAPAWAVLAIACDQTAYCVPPLLLARMVSDTPVRTLTAARITFATIGIGNLVPGQPAPETARSNRELQRSGVSRTQSLAVPLVLLVATPSVAMILLAGPTLLISGVTITLPGRWRVPVIVARGTRGGPGGDRARDCAQ